MTAYQLLHRTAKVKRGETVLVHGAAGRVSTAVLELERSLGFASTGPVPLATVPRLSGSARSRSTTATRTSWRGCASSRGKAWTSCSTGSARRPCAPSMRCGPADGLSCTATTPRSRTGSRTGERGSSGTRRPRPSRSRACSRPAARVSAYRIQKLREGHHFPSVEVAERFPWVEAPAIRSGSARTSARSSTSSVRARSTRRRRAPARFPMRAARTRCSSARRREARARAINQRGPRYGGRRLRWSSRTGRVRWGWAGTAGEDHDRVGRRPWMGSVRDRGSQSPPGRSTAPTRSSRDKVCRRP